MATYHCDRCGVTIDMPSLEGDRSTIFSHLQWAHDDKCIMPTQCPNSCGAMTYIKDLPHTKWPGWRCYKCDSWIADLSGQKERF